MIPTPIRQVLSTIQMNGAQALLIGGQACVFCGAAQVSKDVDLVLHSAAENLSRLLTALGELNAKRIAVPPFDPALLARGHVVHFRCQGGEVDGLRVDVMTRLRDARTPELLGELVQRFPEHARAQSANRPLLGLAISGESEALREALDGEVRAEQAKDRVYWAPLKAELESFRRAEREHSSNG